MNRKNKLETNPVKVIRQKCLDCCLNQTEEVKNCPCRDCPLYPFRFGKNPYRKKKEMNEEQKEQMRQRMEKAREARKVNNAN